MFSVKVQETDFDLSAECEALTKGKPGIGAVVTFTGRVRDSNNGQSLKTMTLEHYPGMAEKQMTALLDEARSRWRLEAATLVHRFGRLYPEDQIVLVVTCSAHRQDAFEAAAFLMDWLKTKAPFWKKEDTSDNGGSWVDARVSDTQASDRWNT